MTGLTRYRSPAAVEAAIAAAARRAHAADPSLTVQERIRLEYLHRFLSRVFSGAEGPDWMLNGGVSMLARVPSARTTTDVDLAWRNRTLDAALDDLRRLAAVDLGDFFRFDFVGYSVTVDGNQQTYTEGFQVTFDVSIGAKKKDRFHVDLVVDVVLTDDVEIRQSSNALDLPKLPSCAYRLYPVVDQIADKVCATLALYGGRPSSREKDLVDLVLLAVTQDVAANKLRRALEAEARVRSLTLPASFQIPASWGARYARLAATMPTHADFRTVDAATDLMRAFLDPLLAREVDSSTWDHTELDWVAMASATVS